MKGADVELSIEDRAVTLAWTAFSMNPDLLAARAYRRARRQSKSARGLGPCGIWRVLGLLLLAAGLLWFGGAAVASDVEARFSRARDHDYDARAPGSYSLPVNPLDPTGPLNHTLRVFLIDREGNIRNMYSSGTLGVRLVLGDVRTLMLKAQTKPAPTAVRIMDIPTKRTSASFGFSFGQAIGSRSGSAGSVCWRC
jgi:hypothetical protein